MMFQGRIWICLILCLVQITFPQRIECNWGSEFLCGDKCLFYDRFCFCGNETITYADAFLYNCCNHDTCAKDYFDGNVRCDGVVQDWKKLCNGTCSQHGYNGFNTIPCENQQRCNREIQLCRGVPMCSE